MKSLNFNLIDYLLIGILLCSFTVAGMQYAKGLADKDSGIWTCTGFFIDNKGDFITARHCSYQKQYFVVYEGQQVPAELIARSVNHDVALFHANIPNTKYLPINSTELDKTSSISSATYGYPQPDVFGNNLKVTTGIASNSTFFPDHINSTAKSCPGNSGGPMVDKIGAVIGVLTGAFDKNIVDKDNCAIPDFGIKSQYVIELATANGISVSNTSIWAPIGQTITSGLENIIFLMYCINP